MYVDISLYVTGGAVAEKYGAISGKKPVGYHRPLSSAYATNTRLKRNEKEKKKVLALEYSVSQRFSSKSSFSLISFLRSFLCVSSFNFTIPTFPHGCK